jgi:hypothetical protein
MIQSIGGEEGIRTLDRVAPIPPFQGGALDQLCDLSLSKIVNRLSVVYNFLFSTKLQLLMLVLYYLCS